MDSLCENSLCESPRSDDVSMEDLISKKVWFKEKGDSSKGADVSETLVGPKVSWKDKLVRSTSLMHDRSKEDDDLKVLNGDIQTYVSNGTPSIDFSDRIYQILA